MRRITRIIKWLSSEELVLQVQQLFGVHYDKKGHNSSNSSSNSNSNSNHDNVTLNKAWLWLFLFFTALGDEVFYSLFIPFWFWNVDGAVGRRMVMVWAISMYIGQGFKDVIRMPRPGPPVHKLQEKWAIEYGMPSTHAIVGVCIPFSILYYTMFRYQYSVPCGLLVAFFWCFMICLSRVYLGMHSVLDIVGGLILAVCLMIPLLPLVDYLDNIILARPWSPVIILLVSISVIVWYPNGDKWTPTRGDTTMIVSVCAGIQIGAWYNYQTGQMIFSNLALPHPVLWPSWNMIGMTILRTVLGFCGVMSTKAIGKSLSYAFISALLGKDKNQLRNSEDSLQNKDKIIVELCYKYFACAMIGFNTLVLFPKIFNIIGIERPTFYTEL